MKQILVPVDFSANSQTAANFACMLAAKKGASIMLFHAIEPLSDQIRQPFSLHEKYLEQVMNDRQNELVTMKYALEKSFPEISFDFAVQQGPAAFTISEFIKTTAPGLVVMGKKGKTSLETIFMGSISKGVISRSTVPVIVVPENYVTSGVTSITVATNHFEKNRKNLDPVIELATTFGAAIHVVAFLDTDNAAGYDYAEFIFRLDSYAEFLKKHFPQVIFTAELLEGPDFKESIERFDQRTHADLLVLFAYPKSLLEKILNRGMAKRMVSKSRIPMFIVPVKDDVPVVS